MKGGEEDNVSPTGLPQVWPELRPEEAQWAKRCLLPLPSPSTWYYHYTLFQTKLCQTTWIQRRSTCDFASCALQQSSDWLRRVHFVEHQLHSTPWRSIHIVLWHRKVIFWSASFLDCDPACLPLSIDRQHDHTKWHGSTHCLKISGSSDQPRSGLVGWSKHSCLPPWPAGHSKCITDVCTTTIKKSTHTRSQYLQLGKKELSLPRTLS